MDLFTFFILISLNITYAKFDEAYQTLLLKKKHWADFANKSHDPLRHVEVLQILSKAAGIYNIDKNSLEGTANTVLLNVIQAEDGSSNEKYRNYLENLFCFYKKWNYKSILYMIDKNATRLAIDKAYFSKSYSNLYLLDYPYELFWNTILLKNNTKINTGFGKGDYEGSTPSFHNFGSLVMLLPALEALQYGYNIIYLDVDMALIHDPISYLIQGAADMTVSPELRSCNYPSLNPYTDWRKIEPNTGVMHVRATTQGVAFFQGWLHRIVNENSMNDQRVVNFASHGQRTMECTYSIGTREYGAMNLTTDRKNNNHSRNGVFTYCYLNEFLFHNGFLEFFCSKGKNGGSASLYTLALQRYGVHVVRKIDTTSNNKVLALVRDKPISSTATRYHSLVSRNREEMSNSNNKEFGDNTTNGIHAINNNSIGYGSVRTSNFISPAILHVNFCNVKHAALHERGFWLHYHRQLNHSYDSSSSSSGGGSTIRFCKTYDVLKTSFAREDWSGRIDTALTEYKLLLRKLNDTDVVQFPGHGSVYQYISGTLREFPNSATFYSMGYDFPLVKLLKDPLYRMIPYGSVIADVKMKVS